MSGGGRAQLDRWQTHQRGLSPVPSQLPCVGRGGVGAPGAGLCAHGRAARVPRQVAIPPGHLSSVSWGSPCPLPRGQDTEQRPNYSWKNSKKHLQPHEPYILPGAATTPHKPCPAPPPLPEVASHFLAFPQHSPSALVSLQRSTFLNISAGSLLSVLFFLRTPDVAKKSNIDTKNTVLLIQFKQKKK